MLTVLLWLIGIPLLMILLGCLGLLLIAGLFSFLRWLLLGKR